MYYFFRKFNEYTSESENSEKFAIFLNLYVMFFVIFGT